MARKPRIEFEGAFYHVIIRGNQRQTIFRDEADRWKFLKILSHYRDECGFLIYAYVLMNNHVHLLVETKEIPLSKIFQGINQSYTMYFNKKYALVGHLLQGRYKAILCDKDEYLLTLIKYLHSNPVRAGMVKMPGDYRWSSHRDYARGKQESIVATAQVLERFSEDRVKAIKLYREYVGDGITLKKEDIYNTVDQRILGSERFVGKVVEKSKQQISRAKRKHEYSLDEIAGAIRQSFGVTLNQMREKSKNRHITCGRKFMCLVAKEFGYKGKEISEYLGKDPAVITRYSKFKDPWKKEIGMILEELKRSEKMSISKSDPERAEIND
jgi:putative transposase